MLVIFSIIVSFKHHCLVVLTVLLEIIMVIDTNSFLKNSDDLHIIQTLKYEIHNNIIVTSISNKNYYVALNSTFCFFKPYVLTGTYMSHLYLQTGYP